MERPEELAEKQVLTAEEAAQFQEGRVRALKTPRRDGVTFGSHRKRLTSSERRSPTSKSVASGGSPSSPW